MTPQIITAKKAIEALREVVSGKENYVDPGSFTGKCRYAIFDEGANRVVPSCLVGTALHSRGVPLGVLASMNQCGGVREVYSNANEFDAHFVLTGGAFELFQAAQMAQDSGRTWGTALEIVEDLWYATPADEN
jgi:hypothetical protein